LSSSTKNLDEFTSYDIEDEIRLRKELEKKTGELTEISKNPDQYGYDLVYYLWRRVDGEMKKIPYGFVELEQYEGDGWEGENLPENWTCYSFLKRKIYKYNWNDEKWLDDLKDNAERAVYLKVNSGFSDCFATSMSTIARNGFPIENRGDISSYKQAFLGLSLSNPNIYRGWKEVISFIDQFMKTQQKKLDEFLEEKE